MATVEPCIIKPNAALHIDQFPADLHPLLREIDDEGNGYLEADELTEVFTMYCDMKKAQKEGSIAIKTLPLELQPTLKVFDVDNDGSVAPLELARAAELYKDSKNQVNRLCKAVVILLVVLLLLVGTIVGLVAVVIEESKESTVNGSGVSFVKDSNTPVGTANIQTEATIFEAVQFDAAQLENVKYLKFDNANAGMVQYTIMGVHKNSAGNVVKFFGLNGAVITVTPTAVQVSDAANSVNFVETSEQTATRRKLLQTTTHGTLSMPAYSTIPYSMMNATTTYMPMPPMACDYIYEEALCLVGDDCAWDATMFMCGFDADSDSDSDSDKHMGPACFELTTETSCVAPCAWDSATVLCSSGNGMGPGPDCSSFTETSCVAPCAWDSANVLCA